MTIETQDQHWQEAFAFYISNGESGYIRESKESVLGFLCALADYPDSDFKTIESALDYCLHIKNKFLLLRDKHVDNSKKLERLMIIVKQLDTDRKNGGEWVRWPNLALE